MTPPSGGEPAASPGMDAPGPRRDEAAATPSLRRRMASFTYEALLLFGLGLIPGAVGAMWVARNGQASWQSDTALRVFALLFYGAYFVWCWSRRGQTLAMQTWRIRIVGPDGTPPSPWRSVGRYVACCVFWFLPAALAARAWQLTPWPSLAVTGRVVVYALSPGRRRAPFWPTVCAAPSLRRRRDPTACPRPASSFSSPLRSTTADFGDEDLPSRILPVLPLVMLEQSAGIASLPTTST